MIKLTFWGSEKGSLHYVNSLQSVKHYNQQTVQLIFSCKCLIIGSSITLLSYMSTFHVHLPCNNETETNIKDQKLLVDAIARETTDWTCKVQVVDKFRPRKSSDSSVHFQKILVQDESEQHVSLVLYGDDILKYENLFGLF
ncbi:uncharacterized protein LOC124899747 [Capsicum annuum]|uniref:uncharacterized protein LOC124899747 n=1 Tax=Capsicum annuum TaxID=4072 RepID=UPI001FB0A930|nr:uncharacterized protein LOC124899747 [Capsicum annuum]